MDAVRRHDYQGDAGRFSEHQQRAAFLEAEMKKDQDLLLRYQEHQRSQAQYFHTDSPTDNVRSQDLQTPRSMGMYYDPDVPKDNRSLQARITVSSSSHSEVYEPDRRKNIGDVQYVDSPNTHSLQYTAEAMREQDRPPQYSEQQSSQSIFFDSEIKKDSEIQFIKQELDPSGGGSVPTSASNKNGRDTIQFHEIGNTDRFFDSLNQVTHVSTSDSALSRNKLAHATHQVKGQGLSQVSEVSASGDVSDSQNIDSKVKTDPQSNQSDKPGQSDKTHVCTVCFKSFRNKPQLSQHELVHSGLRKHVCMYCDKAFKQICHLNQHIRVHTGERPYKCTIEGCGRSFAQLSNLNHHQKNHEEHVRRAVARQYRCETCDRSYANQNSLHTHIQKLHTNLKGVEGTVSSPILLPTPPRKRKKSAAKNGARNVSGDSSEVQTFIVALSDDDDDMSPTQVKLKSSIGPKSNMVLQLPVPSTSVDKLMSDGPLHNFPGPFSQSASSFMEQMRNLQTMKQNHGKSEMAPPQQTFSSHSQNQQQQKTQQQQQQQHHHHQQQQQSQQQQQQQQSYQMSTPLSEQEIIHHVSPSNRPDVTSGSVLQHLGPLVTMSSSPHGPLSVSANQTLHSLRPIISTTPTHVSHHYPADVESQSKDSSVRRVSQHNIFNPAFTLPDRRDHSRYSSNQF